jgi:hypothetical protein
MIDGLVKITDRLIELVKYREEKCRRVFEKLIEPIFTDLLLIHKNYLEMFETVRSLLPHKKDSKQKRNKKLRRAFDFLSQKRVEFEPTRDKIRAIIRALPGVGQKQNKKEVFVLSVAQYLSWTFKDTARSISSHLVEEIHAAVVRSSYPPVERRTGAQAKEQFLILLGKARTPDPTVEDLEIYVSVILDELRRKFALASEAYADIFAEVRDE